MPRTLIVVALLVAGFAVVPMPFDEVTYACTPAAYDAEGTLITAAVDCPASPATLPAGSPAAPSGPVCTSWAPQGVTVPGASGLPEYFTRLAADGALETLFQRECTPGGTEVQWISSPTPKSVANQAFGDLQSKGLPAPKSKMGPPVDKMIVNFETWIAVQPEDPVVAQANAGGITSTVTATPVRIEFHTGTISTKDVSLVECDPWGSIDYGACTWTPKFPSVEKATGTTDLTYHGSISLVWDVVWTSNTGAGGNLGQLTTTTPLRITVMEIQTIGSG